MPTLIEKENWNGHTKQTSEQRKLAGVKMDNTLGKRVNPIPNPKHICILTSFNGRAEIDKSTYNHSLRGFF